MATTTKKKPVASCVHHWMLAAPDGGLVGGACKNCGLERTWAETPAAIKKLQEFDR